MSFIKEFIKLVRFEHALLLAIAVLLSEIIVLGTFPGFSLAIVLSLLVPIFSEMGSFSLNDYLDMNADKENKRFERPLVKGTINPKFAFYFSWVSLIISTILAYFINPYAFLIAFIFNILAIVYNYKLKDLPLVGNFYIALTMSIPLIFGNFVVSEFIHPLIFLLAILAFISGLGREIIKSVQDMKGDKKARNSNSYPILVGRKNALYTSAFLYFIFLIFVLVLSFEINNPISLLLLALISLYFIFEIVQIIREKVNKKSLEISRKFSLIALFLGMLSVLIEVIF